MQVIPTVLPGSYPAQVPQPEGYNPSPLPPPSDYYVTRKELLDLVPGLGVMKLVPSATGGSIASFGTDGQVVDSGVDVEYLRKAAEDVARILAGVPDAYDTLKEIADWIAEDETGTAAIVKSIADLGESKLDKTAVDSSLSATSVNPVQNQWLGKRLGATASNSVQIGFGAKAGKTSGQAIDGSGGDSGYQVAVGRSANGSSNGTAVGYVANGSSYGTAVGYGTNGSNCGTAVGRGAVGSNYGVAVGYNSNASTGDYGVAVGSGANVSSSYGGVAVGFGAIASSGTPIVIGGSPLASSSQITVSNTGVLKVGGKEVGGGNTEVWKGTIDSVDGVTDDMIGAKQLSGGNYPRIHARNKDIHGCTGFSNETDSYTGLRFVLPWDLAMSNDTSYLSPYVEWTGARGIGGAGSAYTTTFVQPLMPKNKGTTSAALPYAVPNFENSPLYWAGHIMYNDASNPASAAVKQVKIPWGVLAAGDTAEISVGRRKAGTTTGRYSHAEGYDTTASKNSSHAEGGSTTASGNSSHAEGGSTTASGGSSHAEGGSTTASGNSSHAEGSSSNASGNASHAEGISSNASGNASHAEGSYTIAQNAGEHAQGKYNKSTEGVTLHSVGIGTSTALRKNAEEITTGGKLFVLGVGGYDGTNPAADDVSDLATVVNAKRDKTDLTAGGIAGFPTAYGGWFTVSDGSGEVVDTLSLTGPATFQGSRYSLRQRSSTDSSREYVITSQETSAMVTVTVAAGENYYKLFTLDGTELGLQAFSGTDTLARKSEAWLVGNDAQHNQALSISTEEIYMGYVKCTGESHPLLEDPILASAMSFTAEYYYDEEYDEINCTKAINAHAPICFKYSSGGKNYSNMFLGSYSPSTPFYSDGSGIDEYFTGDTSVRSPAIYIDDQSYSEETGETYNWCQLTSYGFYNAGIMIGSYDEGALWDHHIEFYPYKDTGLEYPEYDGYVERTIFNGGGLCSAAYVRNNDEYGDFEVEKSLHVGLGAQDYGGAANTGTVFRAQNFNRLDDEAESYFEIRCPATKGSGRKGEPSVEMMGESGKSSLLPDQLRIRNDAYNEGADIFLGSGGPTEDSGAILHVWGHPDSGDAPAVLTVNKIKDINEAMPSTPTQNELIECVKKLWTKFGGTVSGS